MDESDNGLTAFGCDDVLSHTHQMKSFAAGLKSLGNVDVHLVAVEVCIERGADTLVEP